jgi:hypothetical protein
MVQAQTQLAPPAAAASTPQTPLQGQLLAQVLQQMRAQPQTPIGATANLIAAALDGFGPQAAGQGGGGSGGGGSGGAGQWRDAAGDPSGNWFNSPLGQQLGALFGLGQAAQGAPAYAAQELG